MIKALLAVLVALLLAGCSDDPTPPDDAGTPPSSVTSEPPAPTSSKVVENAFTFDVEGGEVVDGPAEVELELGDRVLLEVFVDAPDELHVHGYDKTFKLTPNKQNDARFTADLPGVWEVELHHSGTVLTELRVNG